MADAPRLHYPAHLAAGEDLARLEDILACSDIPELTVRVDFWRVRDRPVAIRLRGLDLDDQDRVRMAAGRAVAAEDRALGVSQHWPTFVVLTLAHGIVSPRLTVEQARLLARKNAAACEQLASLVWTLSATTQEHIDAAFADALGTDLDAAASGDDPA